MVTSNYLLYTELLYMFFIDLKYGILIMKFLLSAFVILILSGCGATSPTKQQIDSANFGELKNKDFYMDYVYNDLKRNLIDPDSLRLSCANPKKAWGGRNNDETIYGYGIFCKFNAKNRMGGYAGNKITIYLFHNDYGFEPRGSNFGWVK